MVQKKRGRPPVPKIIQAVHKIDLDVFEGDIDKSIDLLQFLKKRCGAHAVIKVKCENNEAVLWIEFQRKETEEEVQERIVPKKRGRKKKEL